MSELQYTPATTRGHAYLFAHTLRTIFQLNRERLGDRWNHLGIELTHALVPLVVGADSAMVVFTRICDRWDVTPADAWVVIPRGMAKAWGLPRTRTWPEDQPASDLVSVAWEAIAARLDIAKLRTAVTASPHVFVAVAREYVAREDRPAFIADLTTFDWIADEPEPRPVDLADFESPHRAWCLIRLDSPLSHGGDGGGSNITAMRRESRIDPLTGAMRAVPFVAGGAVRGVMRDVLALDYLRVLGLSTREVRPELANALLSGGAIEAGSAMNTTDNEMRQRVRRLCPVLDLFGGYLDGQLLQGALLVGDALLVCQETAVWCAPALGWTPAMWAQKIRSLPLAGACMVQRHATRQTHEDLPSSQMILHVEALAAGNHLAHSLALRVPGSPVQQGAVARLIRLMRERGKLGAKNQAGFGDVSWGPYTAAGTPWEFDEMAEAAYEGALDAVAGEARAWLTTPPPVAERPQKPAKGGRKGKADAVAV